MRAARIDLSSATWRKSTHSNGQGGDCVEVANGVPGVVPVRDSKRTSPALLITAAAWTAFIDHMKHARSDRF